MNIKQHQRKLDPDSAWRSQQIRTLCLFHDTMLLLPLVDRRTTGTNIEMAEQVA